MQTFEDGIDDEREACVQVVRGVAATWKKKAVAARAAGKKLDSIRAGDRWVVLDQMATLLESGAHERGK